LAIASEEDEFGGPLLRFAEHCRAALVSLLPGLADFEAPRKQALVVLKSIDEYYRYISLYFSEGEYGVSAGVHIRAGLPHVALYSRQLAMLKSILAHELTHVALHRLTMPLWLEEGLAQMVEHELTGRSLLLLDGEMARRHKSFWKRNGLEAFWSGDGFSRPDEAQELSYQLAEILVRLLIEDARPGWFGRGRERQQRLLAFLQHANACDAGEAACQEHLQCGLGDLAARFLGAGSKSPKL
jgi:hypothetical protein